ncbi:hypothetical protein ENBRE01_3324 [Enteropsectra breve]|nr:hypothetical protein ENBRE01_3324 [Enteropsectra breve]
MPQMSYKWSNKNLKKLVSLRCSADWEDRFCGQKGKARQIGELWEAIAAEIDLETTGVDARTQYNYLLNQFKKHDLKAKKSGEGAVKWRFYKLFKDNFIKNPVISPVALIDTSTNPAVKQSDHNEYLKLHNQKVTIL